MDRLSEIWLAGYIEFEMLESHHPSGAVQQEVELGLEIRRDVDSKQT